MRRSDLNVQGPRSGTTLYAVVTTFRAILWLEIDLKRRTIRSGVLEQSRGIYFGLTHCDHRILVAARNLDIEGRVQSPNLETNTICSLDVNRATVVPVLTHECLRDLHQIRAIERWLCVVLGEGSQIAVFDRSSWRLVRLIDLTPLVPAHLQHEAPERRPSDHYHFNSLTFRGNRAFVLAHNWDYGSFALELEMEWKSQGPGRVQLIAVHQALGREAHDVVHDRDTLHVLDSAHGVLILRSRSEHRLALSRVAATTFARGMALSRDYILVCYGIWSAEKSGRARTESRVCVIDRTTKETILDAAFGNWGNPCDILLLSTRDLSDQPSFSFRRALARLFTLPPPERFRSSICPGLNARQAVTPYPL